MRTLIIRNSEISPFGFYGQSRINVLNFGRINKNECCGGRPTTTDVPDNNVWTCFGKNYTNATCTTCCGIQCTCRFTAAGGRAPAVTDRTTTALPDKTVGTAPGTGLFEDLNRIAFVRDCLVFNLINDIID